MGATHSVVKVPPARCAVLPLAAGAVAGPSALSSETGPVGAPAQELRARVGPAWDAAHGTVFLLEPLVAVFDHRYEELRCTVALPLRPGARGPVDVTVVELPAVDVLELRYPASRALDKVLEDVFQQVCRYADTSQKRDPASVLRLHDQRGTRPGAGFLVQVEVEDRRATDP